MYIYRYLRMLANYIVSVHLIMFALAALVDPGHCIFNCLNYKMRLIHLFHAFRSRSAVIPMPIYSMKTPSMYSGILCLIWIIIILKKNIISYPNQRNYNLWLYGYERISFN